jgi:tetratricopeptide (TPR) repeat protein
MARSDFKTVAEMLGKRIESVEEACRLLANTRERCLLILDNADDPSFDYNIYFPSSMSGVVLMTSRCTECRVFSTIPWEALPDLSLADCTELLLRTANIPQDQWETQAESAEIVVGLLQSHTLALIQAGTYVAKKHCTLEDYPKEFEQQRKILLEFSPRQAKSRYDHVYATFEASVSVLPVHALEMLNILSILSYTFLPEVVFEKAWRGSQQARVKADIVEATLGDISDWDVSQPYGLVDMTDNETGLDVLNRWHVTRLPSFIRGEDDKWCASLTNDAIDLLSSLSLIARTVHEDAKGLSMHPLVHAWARDRHNEDMRNTSWLAAGCVITLAARGTPVRTQADRTIMAHVQSWADEDIFQSMFNRLLDKQRSILALVWSCSWTLVQMRDAKRLDKLSLAMLQAVMLDSTRPKSYSIPIYHLRAHSHLFNADWKLAMDLIEGVVKLRQKTIDEKHGNRLSAEHMLGVVYTRCGTAKDAIVLLEHVVTVKEKMFSPEHFLQLPSQERLASAYRKDNQIKKAIELLESIVAIRQKTLASDHPDRLSSQVSLAQACLADKQVKRAAVLLVEVVTVAVKMLAIDHPYRLTSLHELARAYLQDGQFKRAIALLEEVVAVRMKVLAVDHPSRLASQHELARAYLKDGQFKRVIALLEEVVAVRMKVLAVDHPNRLASLTELARAYFKDRQVKKTITLLEEVVAAKEMLAYDNLSRLRSQSWLAQAYLEDGQIKRAVALLEYVVTVREKLAFNDPDRLASQYCLANAYAADGQFDRAEVLWLHYEKMREISQ